MPSLVIKAIKDAGKNQNGQQRWNLQGAVRNQFCILTQREGEVLPTVGTRVSYETREATDKNGVAFMGNFYIGNTFDVLENDDEIIKQRHLQGIKLQGLKSELELRKSVAATADVDLAFLPA